MHRLFHRKNDLSPNENNDTANNYNKRPYSRHKSSSHVEPTATKMIFKPKDSTRIIRIRLVFIRISKTMNFLFN